MKKIKKLNLEIDKEVISSLSNDEMNSVKGGANSVGGTCSVFTGDTVCYSNPCGDSDFCGGTGNGGGQSGNKPNCPDEDDYYHPVTPILTEQRECGITLGCVEDTLTTCQVKVSNPCEFVDTINNTQCQG